MMQRMASSNPKKRGRPAGNPDICRRIADDLRARIEQGAIPRGRPLPSIRQLASHYRAGKSTLERAIDVLKREGRVGVNSRRQLVLKGPRHGAPVPQPLILQILNTYLDNANKSDYFLEIQRGIEHEVGLRKAALLVAGHPRYRDGLPGQFMDLPTEGLLLTGIYEPEVYRRCEDLNVPTVVVDRPPEDHRLHVASVENIAAFEEATDRLIALGHRRIAFVRLLLLGVRRLDPDSKEREAGYRRALSRAGLPRDLSIVTAQARGKSVRSFSGPCFDFFELGREAVRLTETSHRDPQCHRTPAVWYEGKTVGVAARD